MPRSKSTASPAPVAAQVAVQTSHIVRDTFAAENHSAEADEIDIITQPGVGPLEGALSSRVRDGAWSGRSPFTPVKGPERSQVYQADLGGTVVHEKSSFAVTISSRRAFDTPNINAATPVGTVSQALNLRRPNNNLSVESLFDYALTRDQIVRFAFDISDNTRGNLGVGAYDLPGRAYSTTSLDRELRVAHSGPLGRRLFVNTRLQINMTGTESRLVAAA